jgi:hypothetical protein
MSEKKKGFLARTGKAAGGYVFRRFGNGFIREVGTDNFKKGVMGAKASMTPAALDRDDFEKGLNGRYEDGGVSRFAEIMRENGVSEEQLPALQHARRRSAIIMFASAAVAVIFGVWTMITSDDGKGLLMGLSTAFISIVFLGLGARDDFSRWQIQNRRMGGFREYLNGDSGAKPKGTGVSKPTHG